MSTVLAIFEKELSPMVDLIVRVAKGGKFEKERIEAAKTIINSYAKINQTERAREANQIMAIQMLAKDTSERSQLIRDTGIVAGKVKMLK